MKKLLCVMTALAIAALSILGCEAKPAQKPAQTPEQKPEQTPFTAPNDILTYEIIDPEKTLLTVSMLGNNSNVKGLSKAFEAQNPDVQVVCLDITGGDASYRPVAEWVTHRIAPDIMFVNPDSFVDDALVEEYFEDLSMNRNIESFESEALGRVDVNGHVYFLPAPSEINCMIYNKTLFEQYGWQVPATFDEFVELCVKIREDTNGEVQPWNPNAKYNTVFSTAMEAFTYAQLFGGAENRRWYNDYCEGSASFAGHMEPLYELIQTLIDNDILLEEHFSYSATTRGKEFNTGGIAMINAPVSHMSNEKYTFDFMPYPTTQGTMGYVNDYFSAMLCVPEKETRGEKQKDAIERYITFFSSAEGQRALIGETLMMSNVKDVPLADSEILEGLKEVIAQGHKFNRLDFPGSSERNWTFRNKAIAESALTQKRSWTFRDNALSMAKGEKTGAQIIAEIDAQPYAEADADEQKAAKKLAQVTADFTVLDFSFYIADMYREKAGAQIGLINHGVAYRGNLVRLFAGDMLESYVTVLKPRSFDNGSTLVKLSMTGRQIMDALNNPVGNHGVSNSVYAFSGLKCKIAPWNEIGEKYISVGLADGSELDMEKLYTVAAWDGTISPEYITQTLETYEGTWEQLMTERLVANGAIAPANDGRATLVWETQAK